MSSYRTCVLIVVAFRSRTTLGGSPDGMATATTGRRSSATGCVRLVVASTVGGLQRGFWSHKTVDPLEAKVFQARAARLGMCDNFINSRKLLTNQQKDRLEKRRKGVYGRAQVHRSGQS